MNVRTVVGEVVNFTFETDTDDKTFSMLPTTHSIVSLVSTVEFNSSNTNYTFDRVDGSQITFTANI